MPLLVSTAVRWLTVSRGGQVFRLERAPRGERQQLTAAMMDGAAAAGSLLVDLTDKARRQQCENAVRAYRRARRGRRAPLFAFALAFSSGFTPASRTLRAARAAPRAGDDPPVEARSLRDKKAYSDPRSSPTRRSSSSCGASTAWRSQAVDPLPVDHAGSTSQALLESVRRATCGVPCDAREGSRRSARRDPRVRLRFFPGGARTRSQGSAIAPSPSRSGRLGGSGGADKGDIAFP